MFASSLRTAIITLTLGSNPSTSSVSWPFSQPSKRKIIKIRYVINMVDISIVMKVILSHRVPILKLN